MFSGKVNTSESNNDEKIRTIKPRYVTYKILNVIECINFDSETLTHTAQLILSGDDGIQEIEVKDIATIEQVIKNISNKDTFITLLWIEDTYKIT